MGASYTMNTILPDLQSDESWANLLNLLETRIIVLYKKSKSYLPFCFRADALIIMSRISSGQWYSLNGLNVTGSLMISFDQDQVATGLCRKVC